MVVYWDSFIKHLAEGKGFSANAGEDLFENYIMKMAYAFPSWPTYFNSINFAVHFPPYFIFGMSSNAYSPSNEKGV